MRGVGGQNRAAQNTSRSSRTKIIVIKLLDQIMVV